MRTISVDQTRALISGVKQRPEENRLCFPGLLTFFAVLAVLLAALPIAKAAAQTTDSLSQPIVVPSQSSVFNQNSVNLPSAPSVSGQDVVRGADGTTCQSAVASGGPYVDVGVLQSQDFFARDTQALYGRVVFPIGRRASRLDCTRLYKLEIERMRMELEILRMGTTLGDRLALAGDIDAGGQVPLPAMVDTGTLDEARNDALGVGFVIEHTPTDQADTEIVEHNPRIEVIPEPIDVAVHPVHPVKPPAAVIAAEPRQGTKEPQAPPVPARDEIEVRSLPAPEPLPAYQMAASSAQFFVQSGAFSTRAVAEQHLMLTELSAGRSDGKLRELVRGNRILFRTLLGPMPEREAERVCNQLMIDCFVVGL